MAAPPTASLATTSSPARPRVDRRQALALAAALAPGALAASACRRRNAAPGVEPLRVAAASSLAPAFDALARAAVARTGAPRVLFAYGASGTFARQLRGGAPFDVLALADAEMLRALAREGLVEPDTLYVFGRGQLVLVARDDRAGGGAPIAQLADLARPDVRRVAIANPETAPYGRAAREALRARGLWDAVAPRVVVADNVRQALQFATTGNADAALTARAALPADRAALRVATIAPELYAPIEQAAAVVRASRARSAARAFVALLREPAGRAALAAHGFEPPPDAPAGATP